MERILLVEPDYKNKYPPIGLMKIATFHRNRGDIVEFFKGEAPYTKISQMDRVYITTLFTFHYDITVNCIRHYLKYINRECVFVGGIAATLLKSDFYKDTGIDNILCGQLTDSTVLGYTDKVNIDALPLDYDILDDVSYVYPAGDNYFVHTTRGCPRGCAFCAVQTLEPVFTTTNNIINQVERVDSIYGQKRNLLIMDNNILFSDNFEKIVSDIKLLGFTGNPSYVNPNQFSIMMAKIRRRIAFNCDYTRQLEDVIKYLKMFSVRIARYEKPRIQYEEIISRMATSEDKLNFLSKNEGEILCFIEKYRSKTKLVRYVDFNQGIDARLVNNSNIKLLSSIPVNPFRLAYDSLDETEAFERATKLAIGSNIANFSNYMLFNWLDRPEDLWIRLNTAISIYSDHKNKISGFSFPMKYAPINEKDRSYIGVHWNKKYLGAINIILNVTKGIVAKERDFFIEAFGSNPEEFLELLIMPDEFIRFRHFFRDNGLLSYWRDLFSTLNIEERKHLLQILIASKEDRSVLRNPNYQIAIRRLLKLYSINKSQFDRREKTADGIISEIEALE